MELRMADGCYIENALGVVTPGYLYVVKVELAAPLVRGNRRFTYSKHALRSPQCVRETERGLELDLPDGTTRVIPRQMWILWDLLPVIILPPLPATAVEFVPEAVMVSDTAGCYLDTQGIVVATISEHGELRIMAR